MEERTVKPQGYEGQGYKENIRNYLHCYFCCLLISGSKYQKSKQDNETSFVANEKKSHIISRTPGFFGHFVPFFSSLFEQDCIHCLGSLADTLLFIPILCPIFSPPQLTATISGAYSDNLSCISFSSQKVLYIP